MDLIPEEDTHCTSCDLCGKNPRRPEFYWCNECLQKHGVKAYTDMLLMCIEIAATTLP